jgi:hypothetical protein
MNIKRAVSAAALLMAGTAISPALAQVRIEPQTASFVDPATGHDAEMLFGRSGYFMIAGGVVLGGTATFYLERNGTDQPVAANMVVPAANRDGSVSLTYAGTTYQVGMPPGLACPLSEFVARDGIVAYTVPKYMDSESRQFMLRAGLKHHRIAREFDGTPFERLLHDADFAATTPLAPQMAHDLTASLNDANGLNGFVIDAADQAEKPVGSLINGDVQVRYHVYLMAGRQQVEIGGVPLRYFWELDNTGAAGVFAVDVLAQNWPAGTRLTDLTAPGAQPTQYDIVNFYQVAGLFRQLHLTNPAQFNRFVDEACNKTTQPTD